MLYKGMGQANAIQTIHRAYTIVWNHEKKITRQ